MAGTDDLPTAVDYLKTVSKEFAITRGAKGALVWDGQGLIEIAGNKVEVVDTVGAGDLFAGAFLFGLTQGWDHWRAGNLASAASARLVMTLGPRLPREETREVLQGFV